MRDTTRPADAVTSATDENESAHDTSQRPAQSRRITDELADLAIVINRRTVSRHLTRRPGHNSDQAKATSRAKAAGAKRGDVCLHSIADGKPPASRLRDGVTNVQLTYN